MELKSMTKDQLQQLRGKIDVELDFMERQSQELFEAEFEKLKAVFGKDLPKFVDYLKRKEQEEANSKPFSGDIWECLY